MNVTPAYRSAARWLGVALLVATSLRPATARAQEPSVPATPHRVGPVTLVPTVTLRDIGVDTNVYHTATLPISDFTFTVVPTVSATTRGRRLTLSGRTDTEFVYFNEQSSERAVNPTVSGTGQLTLPRLTFAGTASYVNTRDRPSDEIDARLRHVEREGLLDLRVRLFPRLSLGTFVRYAQIEYDQDEQYGGFLIALQLNHNSRTIGATGRYLLSPLTALVGTVETERNRFPVTVLRDSDARRYMGGVELQPRALISGNALVGVAQFESRHPLMPSYAGPIGRGSLNVRMRQSTSAGVGFERDIQYSYSDLAPYYVRGGFTLSLRHMWSTRWSLQGSGGRYTHRYQYADRPLVDGVIVKADETMVDVGAGAGYLLRPGTEITATLGYSERQATSAARHYQGVRFGMSMVYGF
jgi:hypothetical protein